MLASLFVRNCVVTILLPFNNTFTWFTARESSVEHHSIAYAKIAVLTIASRS